MKRIGLVLMLAFAALSAGRPNLEAEGPLAATTRSVNISAVDAKGGMVADLTAADVTVKDGGKDATVSSLTPDTTPMQIAIIVDDAGTGGFQPVVAQVLQGTIARAEFSIRQMSPQALVIQDYTQDVALLKTALGRLGQRGKLLPEPEQLVDGISEAAKEHVRRRSARPVILVLTVGGDVSESSNLDQVLAQVVASGAIVELLSLPTTPIGRVLGDGPKFTGGRTEAVGGASSTGLQAATSRLVDHLMHQYTLTYTLADGVKPNERINIATRRKGVTLLAPTRLAVTQ
jgi:hypothetical protein